MVAADDTAVPALAIVSLALSCVREGTRVILADLTSGTDAGRLLGCTEPGVHRHVAGQRQLTVAIPEGGSAPQIGPIRRGSSASVPQSVDPEVDHAYHAAELLLTLASIDPGIGADHLSSWASDAVVILTAGKPSATRVRTLSELIRMSGTTLTSAVVVGADRTDESLGLLTPRDDEDMQARLPGPAAERVRRDVRPPQPNGSQARGHARPEQEQGERAQARPESRPERRPEHRPEPRSEQRSEALRAESRTEVRHEARPEPRTESRREPRPEPRPDDRHEPRTQPRRAVDLRKDSSPGPESTSGSEDMTTTRPERSRPANAPGPETMPYAGADSEESTVSGEPSGAWRG